MKIKTNHDNENCYCNYCKERIHLGTKFIQVEEEYFDSTIKKDYHTDCAPEENDDDDVYIADENFPINGDLG